MQQIPPFTGEESPQAAEKWINTLVDCTGSFTDSGFFRLLTTRFPSGSSSREWFENLDDAFKRDWVAFEKQFRSRWIAESSQDGPADHDIPWHAFTNHFLNINKFFNQDTINHDNLYDIITTWVEEHIHLGSATQRDDTTLIIATHPLLPPFISAYLQVHVKPPHSTFSSYCTRICKIPTDFLDLERIRRRMSLRTSRTESKGGIAGGKSRGSIAMDPGAKSSMDLSSINVPLPKFLVSQAVGGKGGSPFNDQPFIPNPSVESISAIRMEVGNYIDAVQLGFTDGTWGETNGYKDRAKLEIFLLRRFEYINTVFVWQHEVQIGTLQFKTTQGRLSARFGNASGTLTELMAPLNHKLACFKGRSGRTIDNLEAVWHPISL